MTSLPPHARPLPLRYSLCFADPAGHLLDITLDLPAARSEERFRLPAWIPGSYLIREFARHIVSLRAEQLGRQLRAEKIDKATWQVRAQEGLPLKLRYQVYAWDRSVRGNHFDCDRGFVNPAACLLERLDAPDSELQLEVLPPNFPGGELWRCATSMQPQSVDVSGFGLYRARDYDELIDHPLECSDFAEFSFTVAGVPHRFVVSGRQRGDLERLRRDSEKICATHVALFGEDKPPFERYLFMLHVVDEGYGGLEHACSTALMAPREHLPVIGDPSVSEGYRELLGLISHEYFHAWLVKRIRPAAFLPRNTAQENYTRLLWLFEGFTSYYDDLALVRAGLITEADYLLLLGRHLTQLMRTPGRILQSLAEASFDAWIKYYRADENAPNTQASYYLRGGLVALALDLELRQRGHGTLDQLMRALWWEYGSTGQGVPEALAPVFSRLAGVDLSEFFTRHIEGHEDPDWKRLFAPFGVRFETRPSRAARDRGGKPSSDAEPALNPLHLGLVLAENGQSLPVIRHVLAGSAAHAAGLSAGDQLVAIDGLRAYGNTLTKQLARFRPPCSIEFAYFRYDLLQSTTIQLDRLPQDTCFLMAEPATGLTRPWQ